MGALLDYAPLLAEGALVTISLALLSLALATLLGVAGAAAKLARGIAWGWLAGAYTTIVRGVPDLVLILLVYFAGQRLVNEIVAGLGWGYVEVSAFWAGVLAIGVIYGAYLTETFRGAYAAVPRGQGDAARAIGLSPLQTLLLVTGPQVVRHALPGYGNVWLVLVKSTAVVSVIGLQDLVNVADKAGKAVREPFLFFLVVIGVYLAITAASGWLFARLEVRANRGQPAWT